MFGRDVHSEWALSFSGYYLFRTYLSYAEGLSTMYMSDRRNE